MKTKALMFVLLAAAGLFLASCTTSRTGCKTSAGYVGYGGR